jgi:hypothetical protein
MGQKFNPEGEGYDYETARAYKMGRDKVSHMGSVAPTSDDERIKHDLPENSYVLLKGKKHETMDKAIKAEEQRGSKVEKRGSRYYSVPKKTGGIISASRRADGCAQRGKTKGRMV